MAVIRATFLATVADLQPLVAAPEVADRWDEPSALSQLTVGALAGHLVRGASTVATYLDEPAPEGAPALTAAEYYAEALDTGDLESDLHRGVRQRAREAATSGPAAVAATLEAEHRSLAERLATEPEARQLRVAKGIVMRLDDYLATRLVELTVHADDLAVSVEIEPRRLPFLATTVAIETLVSVGRHRHGDIAVLRALARSERDHVDALRVL